MSNPLGRPPGVRDIQPRKQMAVRASPDSDSYLLSDSGCPEATAELGHQSRCLINCPFPKCQLDTLKKPGKKKGWRKANAK